MNVWELLLVAVGALLGWPAASVPAGWHATDGVPLGVQIVAPPHPEAGGEALILGLALHLERLRPWPRVAPGFEGEAAGPGSAA